MKNATLNVSIFAIGVLFSLTSFAQQPKLCATDEMVAKSLQSNPQLLQNYQAEEGRLQQLDQQAYSQGYPGQNNRVVYTIPVVFHVLHEYGSENISDAQIQDAIRILNEDYSKTNADISQVVSSFQGITGKVDFNFVLAKKDNNGLCINGIDRIVTPETNIGDNGSMLNMSNWPRSKYLNIYTVKTISSGAAGYTYIPGTSPGANADAIMILSTYVGSIGTGNSTRARALTHEVGHWFGLNHVWGGSNNPGVSCGDDGVSDTPVTEGWTSCNLTGNTCGGGIDNVQNFLEYSYCSKMFTAGQATRMQNVITSSTASRNNLWTSGNLTATGVSGTAVLCKADFKTNTTSNSVCQGGSLTFSDLSWNGTPTAWSWTFPGGTPATSTAAAPVVQYSTPGTYNVTLSVSNSSGTVTATKNGFVTVHPNPGISGSPFYSEGFEGSSIPTNWQVLNINTGSNTWVQTTAAGATGTKSVRIVNTSTSDGYVDELISPPFNMPSFGASPTLTFKVAHCQKTSTSDDQLLVFVSANCGQSWTQRMNLKGINLATAPVQSASFTPTATQWATKTVNLTSYTTTPNLLVMFRFVSNAGNNIYLDDINIQGSGVGMDDEIANNLNFNVYPNPMENNSFISFSLLDKKNVDLKIMDIMGREVAAVYNGDLNAGDYTYSISDNAAFTQGIYLIRLFVDNQVFTKKLIIK